MIKTLVISRNEIQDILNMNEVLEVVERAFKLKDERKVIMPCKMYLTIPEYKGDFRAMPAYIDGCAGIKWVSVYPENVQEFNLPSVIATIVVCDPRTGTPIAIMDGSYITNMRTGAAGGVAAKYLARKDSTVIGILGAGRQAETQLMALKEVLPNISEVKVFSKEGTNRFVETVGKRLNLNIFPVELAVAAAEADILVTTTFATCPILFKENVKLGTHINAIGADATGKQELDTRLLQTSKVIVDDIEQACHSGEINVPLREGKISAENIYASLGEIVTGKKKGRENNSEITVFDSTGLAIQDIICAKLVFDKIKGNQVTEFDFSN